MEKELEKERLKRYASGLPTAKQLAEKIKEEKSKQPKDVIYSLLDYWIEAERSKRLDEFLKKEEQRFAVNSEFVLILKKAFKMIEELTQKKLFVANNINTSNSETDLTKESLRKVAEKIGISEPTLSKAFESREE